MFIAKYVNNGSLLKLIIVKLAKSVFTIETIIVDG